MKYLKCTHCKEFNSLNSEYQIFCNACGKKIENNFKAWQKKYPTKTYQDFCKKFGVDKTVKPKNTPFLTTGLQIGSLLVFIVLGYFTTDFFNPKATQLFHNLNPTSTEILKLKKDWKRVYFLDDELSFSSPFLFKKDTDEITFDGTTVNRKHYSYTDNPNFEVHLITATYNLDTEPLSSLIVSNASIFKAVERFNGTDLKDENKQKVTGLHPSILKEGHFLRENEKINFSSLSCFKEDFTLFSLMIFWKKDNTDTQILADKILNSVHLK